jgi:hypothetical protein
VCVCFRGDVSGWGLGGSVSDASPAPDCALTVSARCSLDYAKRQSSD